PRPRRGARRRVHPPVPRAADLRDGGRARDHRLHPPAVHGQEPRAHRRPRHQHRREHLVHGAGRGQPAAAGEGGRDQYPGLMGPDECVGTRPRDAGTAAAYWRTRGPRAADVETARMSNSPNRPVALAVATATALGGLALSGTAFSMTPLATGYMVAAQDAGD